MRFGRRAPDPSLRRPLRWGVAVGAAVAMFVTTSAALAGFSSLASGGGGNLSTKRIFPGVRSAWASDLRDASGGGAETNSSNVRSYADGLTVTTKNWSTAFSATRFDDFDFSGGRPAGVAITSATFNFTFTPSRANDDACFYVDVRRASTNALLGTHGSSGSPSACANSGATVPATVDVSSEVTTTDIANDLRIRVYANNSTNRAVKIDLASVSITTPYFSTTLLEKRWDDEANAVAAVTTWPLVATDGTAYATVGNFATTFNAARYLKFTPNQTVPAGAVISSPQVQFAYKSATAGDTTCWYFEVYNGATLIGTHGSSGTPVTCNATTNYVTDTVAIPDVDTVAEANNLVLKAYMRNSGARKASIELVQVDLSYYLD
jgi:hypothetical protein